MALNKRTAVAPKTATTAKVEPKKATATAPAAPTAPKATAPVKKPSASPLVQAGRGRYREMAPDEQKKLGSESKNIQFIELLGSPFTTVPRGDGKGSESVGLHLRNIGDKEIKVLKFRQKSRKVMDADYTHPTVKTIGAGEDFFLTWAEAGAFVTRDEYNGFILGGDESKHLRYTPNASKNGSIPTTKFILFGSDNNKRGSIADFCRDIATPEEVKEHKVSPEFEEDFSAFAVAPRATGVTVKKDGFRVNAAALAVNQAFNELINRSKENDGE